MEGALALLGSATPSMETYHHAREGKYELLTLASRVADRSLATVEIVDLREDFQQTHQTSPISAALHAGIQECLANGTQTLVLINRRGYSWSVLCRSCGASVQCVNCSISMTHHKQRNRLECHYCGSIQAIPKVCPKCQSKYVYFFGEGSEHLEERLRKEFPGADLSYQTAAGYAGCQILAEAVKRVGTLDGEKLRDAILKLDVHTVFGAFKVDNDGFRQSIFSLW